LFKGGLRVRKHKEAKAAQNWERIKQNWGKKRLNILDCYKKGWLNLEKRGDFWKTKKKFRELKRERVKLKNRDMENRLPWIVPIYFVQLLRKRELEEKGSYQNGEGGRKRGAEGARRSSLKPKVHQP